MKRFMTILLIVLLIISTGCTAMAEQRVFMRGEVPDFGPDEELLEIYICPLVAADAMIIVCGGEVIAVDVGKYNQDTDVLAVMERIGTDRLDMVFNSHPHSDHCGAMLRLVDEITIGKYVTPFPLIHQASQSSQAAVLNAVRKAGIPIEQVSDGDTFTVGGATFVCMQRMFKDKNVNNSSCVLLVTFGGSTLLLTGDIDISGQTMLVRDHPELGKVDIMKAPHHGVADLVAEFMDRVNPEFVFITNGSGSSGPARKMLKKRNIPFVYASHGLVHLSTNGSYWIVDQELLPRYQSSAPADG